MILSAWGRLQLKSHRKNEAEIGVEVYLNTPKVLIGNDQGQNQRAGLQEAVGGRGQSATVIDIDPLPRGWL
jgi:hypothetical protein